MDIIKINQHHISEFPNGITINESRVTKNSTFVIAASDSLHPEQADYVCDGTDDEVEIQDAIDALPITGGKIILLTGQFNLGDSIIPIDNLSLYGQGHSTIMYMSNSVDKHCILVPNAGVSNLILSSFKVDDNKANNAGASALIGALTIVKSNNIILENFWVINSGGHGIMITEGSLGSYGDCNNITITNCLVENCDAQGIYFDDGVVKSSIINNGVNGCGSIGIRIYNTCNYNTISNNVCYNNNGAGISIDSNNIINPCIGNTIFGNVCKENFHGITIGVASNKNVVVGNICTNSTQYGISTTDASDNIITGNMCENNGRSGIELYSSSHSIIDANICKNNGIARFGSSWSGINLRDDILNGCTDCIITNNNCYDDQAVKTQEFGINLQSLSDYCQIKSNNCRQNKTGGISIVGIYNIFDQILNSLFMDVLAVSATHIRSNEDLSAVTPITFTLDDQPDIPRTLSWAFDSHAQITEYDMEVIGTDAKGNTVTETWDENDGWSGETSNAFATITSIKMTSRTGTGAADTMDIGITDVLGLSNVIYSTSDVFKIKKNNTNATVVGAQVNTTYDTYDMSVIGLAGSDDFTIWYKSNLNIIS